MKRTEALKTVNIKGKQYTEVSERVLFLANNFDYEISTDYQFFENQNMWVVKATLTIYEDDKKRVYTGTAQEIIGDGYINKTSALENCETSAVGRACANAGVGVVDSIASADEINKAKARENYNAQTNSNGVTQELKWLNVLDKNKNYTREWNNVNQAIIEGRISSVEQVREVYKVSKEVEAKINELLTLKKTA